MTVKDLKVLCKELGLKGYSKLRKAELEALIEAHREEAKEITKEELREVITEGVEILEYDNHEDWLVLRDKGVGGSDLGAVLGVNPYKSKIDVYLDKAEGIKQSGNNFTAWGHKLEPVIRDTFAEEHPDFRVVESPYTMKKGCFMANVDGLIKNEDGKWGILEIKTTNFFGGKEWAEEIPQSYYCQLLHYMYVTGLQYAYIAVLVGGNNYKEYYVERSEEDIEFLVKEGNYFWQNHVLMKIPPLADGTDAYTEYQKSKMEKAELDNEIEFKEDNLIKQYEEITAKKKAIEQEEKLIKQQITERVLETGAKKGVYGTHKFSVISGTTRRFDSKAYKADHPEEYDKYVKESAKKPYLKIA